MSIQMTGADLIDLAIRIEVEGERFYRQAARLATNEEAQKLFTLLANEEIAHRRVFEGLVPAQMMPDIVPETWEQATAYISDTVDRSFFRNADAPIRQVPDGSSLSDMLRSAIAFEQQTLLFFSTLRDLVEPSSRPMVDTIVAQERDHVHRLSTMLDAMRSS